MQKAIKFVLYHITIVKAHVFYGIFELYIHQLFCLEIHLLSVESGKKIEPIMALANAIVVKIYS